MPSVAKSKLWYIRITAPHEHITNKLKEVRGWIDYDADMAGFHIGGRTGKPHVHVALRLKSELQKQSIDARFKKLFDVKGADYSSKVWDGDNKALSYMYHDESGHVENNLGLSDAEVADLRRMNSIVQETVKIAKEKASYKIVDYVLEKIKESGIQWTAYEIGWCIQQAIYSGRFHEPGDFQLERYINEILCKQCESEDDLRRMFDNRISRMKIFSSGRI